MHIIVIVIFFITMHKYIYVIAGSCARVYFIAPIIASI